jgi:hypothetical protein
MTENEAIELFKERLALIKEHYAGEVKDYEEALEIGIQALETIKKLSDRNMTIEVLENYMQFEDECVKKGFAFKSVIETREKQIPKEPIFDYNLSDTLSKFHCECGNTIKVSHDVGIMDNNNAPNYCSKCGQKLD